MMEFIQQWASLLLSLIAIATTLWNWMTSSSKAAHKRLDKLEGEREKTATTVSDRFQTAEGRLLKLEAEFEHLPGREQVHRIEIELAQLNGKFEVISERLKPVQAIADRLQELEFERANGK